MASNNSIGQDLLNVPMGDMIREMAFAIAEAQIKLDENSIEVAEMMGGLKSIENNAGEITFEDSRVFFGREKMLVSDAIEMHNSTSTSADMVTALGDILSAVIGIASTEVDGKTVYSMGGATDSEIYVPVRLSMLELGFTPTFYQFVDTIIEVRIAIKFTRDRQSVHSSGGTVKNVNRTKKLSFFRGSFQKRKNKNVTTSQVNAAYASKYSYSAEGSSLLRTKLAPVPPPQVLEDRIRMLLEDETTTPSE